MKKKIDDLYKKKKLANLRLDFNKQRGKNKMKRIANFQIDSDEEYLKSK